ncbi:MAG: fibronectin type III domain-containing protein [candidate division Zixibacteria bacterium]|nr:fibronectin type III domain-containing protein [candidate division Zixibacteria bacterium]
MIKSLVLVVFASVVHLSSTIGICESFEIDTDSAIELLSPPSNVYAKDHPGDGGGAIIIEWSLAPDDKGDGVITGYGIFRAITPEGDFEAVGLASPGKNKYIDVNTDDSKEYIYHVTANSYGRASLPVVSNVVSSSQQWFNLGMANLFIIGIMICASVIYFILHARKGKKLFLRKIAGLEAIDDAIGRATEMGRPILFIPGIHDMDDVQTIAGLTIMGYIAKKVAEYDSKLYVPTCRSIVMTTARESIKEAYLAAGRPDGYSDDFVNYITDEQFGYVAAVDGIMVREKPATCFYLGAFFAESLIMAETGNSIGAIQIAGTAMPSQLPFFVAACDYTLIGEELFAASAYLSNEPKQLGSLKGQDVGKVIAMAVIGVGVLFETIYVISDSSLIGGVSEFIKKLFTLG